MLWFLAYAQTFAAALPHHASVVTSLTESQNQIKDAKSKLQETREALGSRRADLAQLWTRGQTLDEMIKIIDEMFVSDSLHMCLLLTILCQ